MMLRRSTTLPHPIARFLSAHRILSVMFVAVLAGSMATAQEGERVKIVDRSDIPLLERDPFDVIVFDSANDNFRLEVQTLDFPDRVVPTGRPAGEQLRFRLLDDFENTYQAPWRSIAKIELFEQMLMEKAIELRSAGEIDEAYKYLLKVREKYPDMRGLDQEMLRFLYIDGVTRQKVGHLNGALAVFDELQQQRPGYRPDANSPTVEDKIGEVLDDVVGEYVKRRDYKMANDIMLRVEVRHGASQARVLQRWRDAIRSDAEGHRDDALRFFDMGEGRKAHQSLRQMLNILPKIEGGPELTAQIMQRFPLIIVGVDQPALSADSRSLDSWSSRRVGRLMLRSIVEFEGQGQDGGQYRFPLGRIEYGDDGKSFAFQITESSDESDLPDLDAFQLSERILDRATAESPEYSPAWIRLLQSVEIEDAGRVKVQLTQAHVLPEALLQIPFDPPQMFDSSPTSDTELLSTTGPNLSGRLANGMFVFTPTNEPGQTFEFNPVHESAGEQHPKIVELSFDDASSMLSALVRGDIDIIDRVFPADLRYLRSLPDIAVESYQLPTVHMLVPNPRRPRLNDRMFRIALMMGIDRSSILNNAILGGNSEEGFAEVSGPFPIGRNDSDPINYGYNFRLKPVTYDYRLAGVFVLQAEAALSAMLEREGRELPPRPKLVLAHAATDLATVACQEIQRQWVRIGVECELRRLPAGTVRPEDDDYDLLYTEVSISEPLVDARPLLAENGIVGTKNSSVDLALRQLDVAPSWPAARRRLTELHTFVQNEAIAIPLYQTMEHFAYRTTVRGVGRQLISLYDNAADWRQVTGPAIDDDSLSQSTGNK